MPIVLTLALQAAASAPAAIDFDLARLERPAAPATILRPCPTGDGEEIVVCGRRDRSGDYPVERRARRFTQPLPLAEVGVGGGALVRAYVETAVVGPGATANRVMIGIRVPF